MEMSFVETLVEHFGLTISTSLMVFVRFSLLLLGARSLLMYNLKNIAFYTVYRTISNAIKNKQIYRSQIKSANLTQKSFNATTKRPCRI